MLSNLKLCQHSPCITSHGVSYNTKNCWKRSSGPPTQMAAFAAGFPAAPSPSRVLTGGVGSRLPNWAPLRAETTHVQEAIRPSGSCRVKEHLKHRVYKLQLRWDRPAVPAVAVRQSCGTDSSRLARRWELDVVSDPPFSRRGNILLFYCKSPCGSGGTHGAKFPIWTAWFLECRCLSSQSRLVPFVMPSQRARRRTEIKQRKPTFITLFYSVSAFSVCNWRLSENGSVCGWAGVRHEAVGGEQGRTVLCAPRPRKARGTLQERHSVCPRCCGVRACTSAYSLVFRCDPQTDTCSALGVTRGHSEPWTFVIDKHPLSQPSGNQRGRCLCLSALVLSAGVLCAVWGRSRLRVFGWWLRGLQGPERHAAGLPGLPACRAAAMGLHGRTGVT